MHDRMTNKEEAELLMSWWKQYGQGILLAVIIGLGIGFGYRYWSNHRQEQAMAASSLYQQFQANEIAGQTAQSTASFQALGKDFAHSIFTQLAALTAASKFVDDGQYEKAQGLLTPLQAKAAMPAIQTLAAIRIAKIDLQLKQPNKALQAVSHTTDLSMAPIVNSVQAQAYGMLGNAKQASKLTAKVMAAYQVNQLDTSLLRLNAGWH